jgi:predicted nucleic acid-binding protein
LRLYLDTSALVKLYTDEEGSTDVHEAVSRARIVATSAIAYVEARTAFARRHREGGFSPVDFRRCVRRFDAEWPRYVRLEVTYSLIRRAAGIAERYRLRAYDAVHLESALTLRERVAAPVVFGCWDAGLVTAARRAGLDTVPGRDGLR